MNQKHTISSLIAAQEKIIHNGRSEAFAEKNSLERMMYTAIREGRTEDAAVIEAFVSETRNEIQAFRKIAQIGRDVKESGMRALASKLLPSKAPQSITPRKLGEIAEKQLSPATPFLCIEGVSSSKDGGKTNLVLGPYFAVLASNVSEAVDLPQDETLVCTFSRAASTQAIELRIWKLATFKELFKGDTLETSQIALRPDSNDNVTKITGPVQDLFLAAADHMGRAALSKNPPAVVSDKWLTYLKDYGGIAVEGYKVDN